MTHHPLDVHPIPKETSPLYVNEPWLIDLSILEQAQLITNLRRAPDQKDDNIRIYVPLDLNKDAILRRLNSIIYRYGEANEENEMDFSQDVRMLISQIEIYDQIWYGRHMPEEGTQRGGSGSGERVYRKTGRNPGWMCRNISI